MLMKVVGCVLLGVLLGSVSSVDVIPDFLKSDVFNIYRHAAVQTREVARQPVLPEMVTYYMYSKENPTDYIRFTPDNMTILAEKQRKIVFFIHGWTNSRQIPWYENLKNAFMKSYPDEYVVVQIDWSNPARQLYYVSSVNTYDIAKMVADLIIDLNENYGIDLDDILLVGHSLGGQTVGFVGKHIQKQTQQRLRRIVALDPAGPYFDTRPEDKRLNPKDADIVVALHTDGGTFGFQKPCGTIDFFPNGGSSQTGCKRIDLADIMSVADPVSCDHMRAPDLFTEAIANPGSLVGTKCDDWKHYMLNKCDKQKVALGDLTTRAKGNFYMETNKDKPFSREGRQYNDGINKVLNVLKPNLG